MSAAEAFGGGHGLGPGEGNFDQIARQQIGIDLAEGVARIELRDGGGMEVGLLALAATSRPCGYGLE